MNKVNRTWNVNGQSHQVQFEPLARLLDILRDDLQLMSIKEGCGEGECGSCSVLLNGEVHLACLVAAAQVDDGSRILTAEGLGQTELGRNLQRTFAEAGAVQCGYCIPGMLISSFALLSTNPQPSTEEIRQSLSGNLCRCTGYTKIIQAVKQAAERQ